MIHLDLISRRRNYVLSWVWIYKFLVTTSSGLPSRYIRKFNFSFSCRFYFIIKSIKFFSHFFCVGAFFYWETCIIFAMDWLYKNLDKDFLLCVEVWTIHAASHLHRWLWYWFCLAHSRDKAYLLAIQRFIHGNLWLLCNIFMFDFDFVISVMWVLLRWECCDRCVNLVRKIGKKNIYE